MTAQQSTNGGNLGLLFNLVNFGWQSGGGTDLDASNKLMGLQSYWWKKNTQWANENGYKYMRSGLENADYNPLLAIGAQPVSGAMPTGQATEGQFGMNAGIDNANYANAQTNRMLANENVKNIAANTAYTQNLTENLGNSPFNALGNFIKGFLGYESDSSTRAFTSLGTAAKKYGFNKLIKLNNKIKHLSDVNNGSMFDIGVSNTDDGYIRMRNSYKKANSASQDTLNGIDISLSKEEQKIINDVLKNAKTDRSYSNRPPKSLLY